MSRSQKITVVACILCAAALHFVFGGRVGWNYAVALEVVPLAPAPARVIPGVIEQQATVAPAGWVAVLLALAVPAALLVAAGRLVWRARRVVPGAPLRRRDVIVANCVFLAFGFHAWFFGLPGARFAWEVDGLSPSEREQYAQTVLTQMFESVLWLPPQPPRTWSHDWYDGSYWLGLISPVAMLAIAGLIVVSGRRRA